jgi:molecular chaperone DnaK
MIEGEDIEAMKAATDALGQLIQKIGASVYESQEVPTGASEAGAGPSSGANGEDVIDGEVKE